MRIFRLSIIALLPESAEENAESLFIVPVFKAVLSRDELPITSRTNLLKLISPVPSLSNLSITPCSTSSSNTRAVLNSTAVMNSSGEMDPDASVSKSTNARRSHPARPSMRSVILERIISIAWSTVHLMRRCCLRLDSSLQNSAPVSFKPRDPRDPPPRDGDCLREPRDRMDCRLATGLVSSDEDADGSSLPAP